MSVFYSGGFPQVSDESQPSITDEAATNTLNRSSVYVVVPEAGSGTCQMTGFPYKMRRQGVGFLLGNPQMSGNVSLVSWPLILERNPPISPLGHGGTCPPCSENRGGEQQGFHHNIQTFAWSLFSKRCPYFQKILYFSSDWTS